MAAAAVAPTMPKHDSGHDIGEEDSSGGERGWREYAAGGGSAVVAITCTFPINKAMFRQQERRTLTFAFLSETGSEKIGFKISLETSLTYRVTMVVRHYVSLTLILFVPLSV